MNTVTAERPGKAPSKPWYREPWPWALMAGPAIVVVAGVITGIIAFSGADGLVADDYYKQGLGINRQIARDQAAVDLGIEGEIRMLPGRVRLTLRSTRELPDRLTLRFVHPGRAAQDIVLHPARTAEGHWEAPLEGLAPGRWRAIVETAQWRIAAQMDPKSAGPAALSPGVR